MIINCKELVVEKIGVPPTPKPADASGRSYPLIKQLVNYGSTSINHELTMNQTFATSINHQHQPVPISTIINQPFTSQ